MHRINRSRIAGISFPDSMWGTLPLPEPDDGANGGSGAGDSGSSSDAGAPPAPDGADAANSSGKTFTQADLERQIDQRLARERKKYEGFEDLKAKAARLDEIEKASATDLEKAIAKTREETLAEVQRNFGERAAKATLKAQLETRMKPADAAALVEDLSMARFVDADGEVDEDAIAQAVARLAPRGPVDLGQGGRGDSSGVKQVTQQELSQLYAEKKFGEIEKARQEGRLNLLLGA